ncbi:porin family protein [Phocaeicola sp.]
MKKLIILAGMLVLMACSAFAQQGKQAFGFHLGYGTEIESVGIGLKYQYNLTDQIRLEPSADYYFKNDGLSMFDINLNAHYLCPVSSSARLYPIFGFTYTNWNWDLDGGYDLSKSKFGVNLGAGAEFDLNANWMMNFEIKYQIISDWDQGVFNLGFAYKF